MWLNYLIYGYLLIEIINKMSKNEVKINFHNTPPFYKNSVIHDMSLGFLNVDIALLFSLLINVSL
jgi:hypothetical protein